MQRENRHGQALDPHVDFNYDPATKLHRKLNLLVYLNKEWREAWGGSIELHSDPRRPDGNRITSFTPAFNRAVIFETNERSWHGFPRIILPEDKRHLSRKSLSIYLYTRTRPAHEIVPEHGTFYVQRPLPSRYHPGLELNSKRYRRDHELAGRARRLDPEVPDDRDPDKRPRPGAARAHSRFGSGAPLLAAKNQAPKEMARTSFQQRAIDDARRFLLVTLKPRRSAASSDPIPLTRKRPFP